MTDDKVADNREATLDRFRKVYVDFLRSELVERDTRLAFDYAAAELRAGRSAGTPQNVLVQLAWEVADAELSVRKSIVDEAKDDLVQAVVQDAISSALVDYTGVTDLVKRRRKLKAEGYVPAEEPSVDTLVSWYKRASGD